MVVRIIKITLLVAIAAVLVNDGGRYVQSLMQLSAITKDIATVSATAAKQGADRNASWQAGESYAEKYGAFVYGFDISAGHVHVWVRQPVKGTWVVQLFSPAVQGKRGPINVEDEDVALVQ